MIDKYILNCMSCFPGSFINQMGELIAEKKTNSYICLSCIENERELKAAVLEYVSRAACDSEPYSQKRKNDDLHISVTNAINRYLGTNFTRSDMYSIYDILGNGLRRDLTFEFMDSGYNMAFLLTAEV